MGNHHQQSSHRWHLPPWHWQLSLPWQWRKRGMWAFFFDSYYLLQAVHTAGTGSIQFGFEVFAAYAPWLPQLNTSFQVDSYSILASRRPLWKPPTQLTSTPPSYRPRSQTTAVSLSQTNLLHRNIRHILTPPNNGFVLGKHMRIDVVGLSSIPLPLLNFFSLGVLIRYGPL